jgi:hypothetical protein
MSATGFGHKARLCALALIVKSNSTFLFRKILHRVFYLYTNRVGKYPLSIGFKVKISFIWDYHDYIVLVHDKLPQIPAFYDTVQLKK